MAFFKKKKTPTMEWWRFDLLTDNEDAIKELEDILQRRKITRYELAVIVASLRIAPELSAEAFGVSQNSILASLLGYRGSKSPNKH
ncbi:MAG: hypothetical protein ACI3XE_06510 [Eubacteriales bacterium]